ncbi:hypothetical protein K431DRAFT_287056 [Polychaeton citri CBS 116435]|uniref:Ubiquitin-protein ligase n=1 Tax=Polychaeton citri CBS 116435 TaxID=1314669 RepID=A0A9P4Q1U0_9PEZI|nr:hypothetical protein K431DRAFT_287056 [Polychaeton citri CBS 116435]
MEAAQGTLSNSSAMDFLLAVPRFAQRAGSFAFYHMPEAMDGLTGKLFSGGSVIADATGQQTANSTITNTSGALFQAAQSTALGLETAVREGWRERVEEESTSVFGMLIAGIGKMKSFGGIFSYMTSRWALATFTAAIILNRAQFYASSRQHLRFRWYIRLAVYLVPIMAFLIQTQSFLQAMRCQTSPDFALLRYGDPSKNLSIDFASDEGFLYELSKRLLFWQDDATCCAARHMSPTHFDSIDPELKGTMSLLFRFFLVLCTGQLFETLACALQGRQPMPETGMTLFEHSLAFAECEAMISSALGLNFFGLPATDSSGSDDGRVLITRNEIMQRLNVPPEVLLVCLISCFSHLTSAVLAVTGIRDKVRLISTSVWAICYMSAFTWTFAKVFVQPVHSVADLGVLRFPTVCIVGFIPHLLILCGIIACLLIYGFALLVTVFSIPDDEAAGLSSFKQRFTWAYQNLQANVQFSNASSIRIKMSEDFYTTLLKVGFSVLTAASEAVYLNEGSRIQVAQMTWLERKRIDEMATDVEKRRRLSVPQEILGEGIARGVGFYDHQHPTFGYSPYARERKSRPTKSEEEKARQGGAENGLGLSERRGRMQLTADFIAGLWWLILGLQAQLVVRMLQRLGIERRPSWLTKLAGGDESNRKQRVTNDQKGPAATLDFWMVGSDGKLSVPDTQDVDVEVETRRRLQHNGQYSDEEGLGDHLYSWWRKGGWFGTEDSSGDFQATEIEDDLTSVISMSTNASNADDDSDMEESGQRTPTQERPFSFMSREATPDGQLDTSLLSRLLNPQSNAEREEARLLSHTLQTNRITTRSQYRRSINKEKSQLLAGLRPQPLATRSDEEEERDLEHFILEQRAQAQARAAAAASAGGPSTNSWEAGGAGMGEGGPQCVVCQSSPRAILVWPCGCLSMCDDCRVGLAMRNHTKCICCRTDLAAYSRLYVP